MYIDQTIKLDFSDVLIRPKRSTLRSRSEVDLTRTYKFRHAQVSWTGVPVIAANMDHTGTFAMAAVLGEHQMMTALSKFVDERDWQAFHEAHEQYVPFTFVSSGTRDSDFEQLQTILESVPVPFICLDVANGYTEFFVDYIKRVREAFPKAVIMAGNVVTGEMTEELILSGADIVKIGIGPGSVCTTRLKAGVGYPQLSAVIECADAAHGLGGHVCSDGGCACPGDVAKAFGAGADFVMLGGMFSGHDECMGDVIEENGRKFKRFYGMSSAEAMNKYHGEVADYRASEGKSVNVPYRGAVKETVLDILGGVRSACTYVGAARLKELSKRTTFIRTNIQLNEVFNAHHVD